MGATETFQTWRGEIAAEAEQIESELATARREQSNAEAAYRTAADSWEQLQTLAARGVAPLSGGMASALFARLRDGRDEALRGVSRARGAAMARVRSLEEQIAGRRLALRQIDAALSPTQRTNVHELGPRPKKPAPIDFDTITPPQELKNVSR